MVKKYYPQDFIEPKQELLESQSQHYELDVIKHQDFQNMSTISELCKSLIQELRDDGWEPLLASVISFCEQHEIDIPDMNARYTKG